MENQEYLETKIKPIMEVLVFQTLTEKPDNLVQYMLDWLTKTGGYTLSGLTSEEEKELDTLRKEITKYRVLGNIEEIEQANIIKESLNSDESDIEDKDNNQQEMDNKKKQIKGKGPRIAVSAEVYGQFNKKEDFVPRFIKKNDNQINRIKSRILQSFIFSNLDPKDVNIVIGAMEEKVFKEDEVVINQGEQGDCLFVIESGNLDCFKRFTKDGKEELVKKYSAGDSFGELALLYNAPRAAKVVAKTNCILWALDRETFNNIVKDAARKKRERYETFLRSVEVLSTFDAYELTQICDALKTCTFREGDYVIREGEIGDKFYILEEGEAVAIKAREPGKPPETVLNYKKGEYFGELALLRGEPRAASIVARSELKLVSLDRYSFKRLLGPLEEVLKRKSLIYFKK